MSVSNNVNWQIVETLCNLWSIENLGLERGGLGGFLLKMGWLIVKGTG